MQYVLGWNAADMGHPVPPVCEHTVPSMRPWGGRV